MDIREAYIDCEDYNEGKGLHDTFFSQVPECLDMEAIRSMILGPRAGGKSSTEKVYSVPPQYKPMAAPRSLYLKAFGVGILAGSLLEYILIRTGYYGVMRDAKIREMHREWERREQQLQE